VHGNLRRGRPIRDRARGWGLKVGASLAVGLLAAALSGLLIGVFCVRLTRGYLAMATLAFAQGLYVLARKWSGLTGGDNGLIGSRCIRSSWGGPS